MIVAIILITLLIFFLIIGYYCYKMQKKNNPQDGAVPGEGDIVDNDGNVTRRRSTKRANKRGIDDDEESNKSRKSKKSKKSTDRMTDPGRKGTTDKLGAAQKPTKLNADATSI